MKKFLMFLCAMSLVFGVVGSANAVLFELNSYDVNLTNQDPGLVLQSSPILPTPAQVDLEVCNPVTLDLFYIWTDESYVNPDDMDPQPISVDFAFTLPPPPFGGTVEGETYGISGWWWFINYQYGEVAWDGPTTINFGPLGDGELVVSLSNETFNYGLYGLWGEECWGATVEATFHLTNEASPVPEPATMLLLGSGLIGLVGLGRKKFFKKS